MIIPQYVRFLGKKKGSSEKLEPYKGRLFNQVVLRQLTFDVFSKDVLTRLISSQTQEAEVSFRK
jgi:hypothetical protein